MKLLFAALVLGLAIEGASFALFPAFMRKAMLQIAEATESELRRAGLVAIIIALLLGQLLVFVS